MSHIFIKYNFLFLFVFSLLSGGAADAQPAGYTYYKVITIQASEVEGTGTLTDFPVLISITNSDLQANVQNPNGYDIIFATDVNGNNILNHEIESYNSFTGELVVWLQIPSLSGSSNTQIYMFYGNSSINIDPSTTSTWDSNYKMVLHMSPALSDATINSNNAINNGSTSGNGIIINSREFNANENDYLEVPHDPSLDISNQITISAWVNVDDYSGQPDLITQGDYTESYSTWINTDGTLVFPLNGNSVSSNTGIPTGSWQLLTFVRDATGRKIYINRILVYNDAYNTPITNVNQPLFISNGTFTFDGRIDEVRLSNTARSVEWIATSYNNQNNPSAFYTVGPQEFTDKTAPNSPTSAVATAIAGGDIIISFDDMDETGSGVVSYSIQRAAAAGGTYTEIGIVSDNESVSYSFTDNTASDGTTYYYIVKAIDEANNQSAASAEVSATSDAIAPVPEVATVDASGTTLQLDYDESLKQNSVPATSDYTILVGGTELTVTNIIINGDKVNLTLSPNVKSGDNVTVSYTASTNPAQDDAGNNAADLNNQPAVNNVETVPPALNDATINGSNLILSYNEELDANSVPTVSDYTVTVNGTGRTLTNIVIDGSRALIELDPAVVSGDVVLVDYSPGTNPVRDIAGNAAASFTDESAENTTFNNTGFGPNPCPISNNHDAAWACFDGTFGGTSMDAYVGDLKIATVDAAAVSQTTFSPNALQQWASGSFFGDEYNGPQLNPSGNTGNTTSFDITIPDEISSESIILVLNRLTPDAGNTTYTLEAFDASSNLITVDDWLTGQGTDGGVCSNAVNLVYVNGNTRIEFQPAVSTDPDCATSSQAIWLRITDTNVERIEIRKTTSKPDNIYIGLAVTADFGDAPNAYNTKYSSRSTEPAFHLLNSDGVNTVYFGSYVDGDGNGSPNANATGDDLDIGLDSGVDEDGIATLPVLRAGDEQYSVRLACTNGGAVSGWIDFDRSNTFDFDEYATGICSGGSATLIWNNLSDLVQGQSYARFRIASNSAQIAYPAGFAADGEVEDYAITIQSPAQTDLTLTKTVNNATPTEGENVTFTVAITNNGPQNATDVQVTDQLPPGLTFVSSDAEQGAYSSSTGIWNVGNIVNGGEITLAITAAVDADTEGQTITNEAAITDFNENDPDPADNTASSGVTVIAGSIDIEVAMVVDNNQPSEADIINYTITVTNKGPESATNLQIIDQLPSGLIYIADSPSKGSFDEPIGIWSIGTLPVNDTETLALQVQVDNGTENSSINNVVSLDQVDQNDDDVNNNTASVTINVVTPQPPASCSERPFLTFDSPTLISGIGGQVGAVYEYQNVAPNVNAEVEIVTIFNVDLISIDQSNQGPASHFQPRVEAVNKSLEQGYIDFEVRFYQADNGNRAFLSFTSSGVDVDGDGGSDGTREFVGFQRLTTFTIEETTNLATSSSGIFTTFEAPYGGINGIDPTQTDFLVYTTYTNESEFRIRAGIKEPTDNPGGDVGLRLFSFNFDPCIIENFDQPTSSTIVDVSVTKSVDNANPRVDDTVTYTVKVENEQGNAVNNIEVTDQLPAGLTFVSATPSGGMYDSATGIWDVGELLGRQSATLTLKATVDNGQEGNLITNTATITNHSGTDGNTTNNSTSVNLQVFDPGSSLQCTDLPYYSFTNPLLAQGVENETGAIYRFSNIRSGVDALVEITVINDATLNDIDDDSRSVSSANLTPSYTLNASAGYIEYKISFVETGTSTPVKQNFAMTALDIDGETAGGATVRDFFAFVQQQATTVETGNAELGLTSNAPYQRYTAVDAQNALPPPPFDVGQTNHMVYLEYKYTNGFKVRTGANTTGGFSGIRFTDLDFRLCLNQEFVNPVRTERNADIAISKTTDNPNPLPGQTVNFTITVTNNGPESATGIEINENLPGDLTLVSENASQGDYDQLSNVWNVGALNTGNSATLVLETSVNEDAPETITNTAFLIGLNQVDSNTANDTSSVTLEESNPVKGIVFIDKTGDALSDGDSSFDDATGDQQAAQDVEVHLFKDGGDGLADGGDDIYVRTVTTNSTGHYVLQMADGTYWIAVDSRTGDLSDRTIWAEQTYAPADGLCTDGSGNTTSLTNPDVCFGGRRGNQSDLIPSIPSNNNLADAEHLAKVTMNGAEITGINFGFSFNVVTNSRDGDDDPEANRSIQGSFRQFIQNANSLLDPNEMRFVPATSVDTTAAGGNWWSITLSKALPAVTGNLTTIDGTAYDLNNPTQLIDTNTGSLGTGGTVGLDQLPLPLYPRKELDINLNNQGANAFRINSTGSVSIKNLAFFNNNAALITIENTGNGLVENNFIGVQADGTLGSLGLDGISSYGISLSGTSSSTVLINENYFSSIWLSGIISSNSNAAITVTKNQITGLGASFANHSGITGAGTWIIEQNLISENGSTNIDQPAGGSGIRLGASSGLSQNNVIQNNTIKDNTVAGITILNNVSSTLITKNIITGNGTNYASGTPQGAGIRLTTPGSQPQQGIKITQNSFYDNYGLGIDIVQIYSGTDAGEADGVNPNDGAVQSSSTVPNTGLDYPVFTLVTLENDILHIEGYVGMFNSRLSGPFTIEIYKAADDGNNNGLIETGGNLVRPHGEGKTLIGTITSNADGTFSEDFDVSSTVPVVLNDRITAIAIDGSGNTSEFGANARVVPTGVTVHGYVFHDTNHNSTREGSEQGLSAVTVVLYNLTENNCKSVKTNGDGFYEFENVLNGNYKLIEAFGQSIPFPDQCIPAAADPSGYISTTSNIKTVSVNNLPQIYDFGDYNGSKIEGEVFNDNGTGGGTANDASRNGTEAGIETTILRALNGSTAISQTTAAADGSFTLFIPKSGAPDNSTITIKEVNQPDYITIGGAAGTTGGAYSKANDAVTFTNTVASIYTGVAFADVPESKLLNDGLKSLGPGESNTFTHKFEANTAGKVTFTLTAANNPSGLDFSEELYKDTNCNGAIDAGEPLLSSSDEISVTAEQNICLIVKVTAPAGAGAGASSNLTLGATFVLANTSPAVQQSLSRNDIVDVSLADLNLNKSVDKANALPGEVLTYTIVYTNKGDQAINSLVIKDEIPPYTTFKSASFGPLPNDLTGCTITEPPPGQTGTIIWTFTGTLAPEGSGTLTFKVTIDQ